MSESADSDPYQVMPDMGDEAESSLKAGIRENGVENPIHIDEDGNIIDGHHRVAICDELGIDDYPTKVHGSLTEQEKVEKAYALNLQERQLDHGQKQELVEQYLTEHWDGDDCEGWQSDVAGTLGVSQQTVSDAFVPLKEDGKLTEVGIFSKSGQRGQVQDYINENPDASNRDVAESVEADVSHTTVGNWRNEWEDDDNDERPETTTTSFSVFSPSGDDKDRERVKQISEAQEQGSDEAHQQAESVDKGETTLDRASRKVQKEQNREIREQKQEQTEQAIERVDIPDDNPTPRIIEAEAGDLPLDDESVNLIITSPPYNLGHDDWKMGGEGREPREDGIGYADDMSTTAYQNWQLDVFDELYRVADEGASFFYNHKPRQSDGTVIHPVSWLLDPSNPWTLRQELVWDRKSTHNHTKSLFWNHTERVYWLTKGRPDIPEEGVALPDVWRFHGPVSDTDHPAPFTDELPAKCLEAVATDGDVVLDPFGGSMTTCEVAAKVGYESIGVDVEPEYVERAREQFGVVRGGQ